MLVFTIFESLLHESHLPSMHLALLKQREINNLDSSSGTDKYPYSESQSSAL